jgi:hypothetical protein
MCEKGECANGPDEHGNWPCDPQVLFGGKLAECQVCGRVAAWGHDDELQRRANEIAAADRAQDENERSRLAAHRYA